MKANHVKENTELSSVQITQNKKDNFSQIILILNSGTQLLKAFHYL